MILVTGGAGVVGARLVRGLATAGHAVRALTLPGDPNAARLADTGCEIAYGDVADAGSLVRVFDGVHTVYHLAAVIITRDPRDYDRINVGGVRNVVAGARAAGVTHFVHVSSAAALHPEGSAYARSKLEGERIVSSQDAMRFTIVRPTLVYDRDGGQEFRMFLAALERFPVAPFVGLGRARKNPVHADDVVKGLLAIAGNPRAHGKTYALSGGEAIPVRELAKLMLRLRGSSRPIVPVPVPLCRLAAFVMERVMSDPPLTRYAVSRIVEDADLDNSEARRDLGYDPVGVREGLARC
ncbi:MAG: NAD-dependent epimerase/dehydratase family protein [Deltaproteobacteria bacterium]|nr:NAD-dependent epimerase/dehydratase family protein [Deltaproteobacteria bacterium]